MPSWLKTLLCNTINCVVALYKLLRRLAPEQLPLLTGPAIDTAVTTVARTFTTGGTTPPQAHDASPMSEFASVIDAEPPTIAIMTMHNTNAVMATDIDACNQFVSTVGDGTHGGHTSVAQEMITKQEKHSGPSVHHQLLSLEANANACNQFVSAVEEAAHGARTPTAKEVAAKRGRPAATTVDHQQQCPHSSARISPFELQHINHHDRSVAMMAAGVKRQLEDGEEPAEEQEELLTIDVTTTLVSALQVLMARWPDGAPETSTQAEMWEGEDIKTALTMMAPIIGVYRVQKGTLPAIGTALVHRLWSIGSIVNTCARFNEDKRHQQRKAPCCEPHTCPATDRTHVWL